LKQEKRYDEAVKKTFLLGIAFLCLLASAAEAGESLRETPAVKVFRECSPSVVNISTERVVFLRQQPLWGNYGNVFDDYFNQYSSAVGAMKLPSLGSGVVVSEDGLIATNAHVIQMASKIIVILQDGSSLEARVIGTDVSDDIALIKVDPPKPLKPVKFAKDVLVGETVVAIGNPFGLQNSVSSGIISGTNRSCFVNGLSRPYQGLIQTDASINPGSSGGGLLNLDGELVGINLSIVQNAQNIGFVIPNSKIAAMLKEYERVKTSLKNSS
jgi:serine protease Do